MKTILPERGDPVASVETADERTAEIEDFKDHPEIKAVLQYLADSYAKWQVYPIPPGLAYVKVQLEEGEVEPPLPPSPVVGAIVTAVSGKFVPPDLDESQLHRSIQEGVDIYFEALKARSKDDRRDQVDWLKQTCETAQQLADLLKPENVIRIRRFGLELASELASELDLSPKVEALYAPSAFDSDSDLEPLRYELTENLIPRFRSALEDLQQVIKLLEMDPELKATYRLRSPFELLVGVLLPRSFKSHFRHKATFTLNGPYARFAEQVLKVFGIKTKKGKPYTRSAIVRALTDATNGRTRRKK
jgi:hypothetical protein